MKHKLLEQKPFRIITLKQRLWGGLSMFFLFIPLFFLVVWVGLDDISNGLAFPPSVSFQWITMFIPFSLLMMLPLFILIIPSIFTGKEMAAKYAVPLVKIMFGGFVVAILAAILYAVYYTNQLEQRGYVACKGTPSGFTPGAGKQYVTDLSLCKK